MDDVLSTLGGMSRSQLVILGMVSHNDYSKNDPPASSSSIRLTFVGFIVQTAGSNFIGIPWQDTTRLTPSKAFFSNKADPSTYSMSTKTKNIHGRRTAAAAAARSQATAMAATAVSQQLQYQNPVPAPPEDQRGADQWTMSRSIPILQLSKNPKAASWLRRSRAVPTLR
jgi:hypothetical protein